jgi:ElaB/YqjD/DUF883 family membrane-anchored ribosome-binding protein
MNTETERIEADVQQSRHRLNDTLDQLGSKFSPGQMLDEGLDLIQGQAGQLAKTVGRQVRDNPVPIALIGLGIAWLVVSNRRASGVEDPKHRRRYRSIEEARWATPRMPNEDDETYNERVHEAYAKALDLKQKAGEAAHDFKERVKRTVEDIQHAASRTLTGASRRLTGAGRSLGDARRKVGGLATQTGERITHMASDARHLAEEQAQRIGHAAVEARHKAERYYDQSPLTAGAIALAVGALIGGAAPLSRTERRTLRGVGDALARTSADLAERGARVVDERVHAADDGALH